VEGNVETPPDQSGDDLAPTEPDADEQAAHPSPADASGADETASAQESVTEGENVEPPSANVDASSADATPPAPEKADVASEQEAPAASEPAKDVAETAETTVVAAEAPETPAAQEPPQPTVAATAPQNEALYTIQVGAFRTKAYANAQLDKLKGLGYPAYIFEVKDNKQQALYLVCFGDFQTLTEAGGAVAAFKEKEKMQAVVMRPGSW